VRIEFGDDVVRAFCERLTGHNYPWSTAVRRPLMVRMQALDAARDLRDIQALRSLRFMAADATRGSIHVDDTHRLHVEFLPGPPMSISIQGLTEEPPTGVRNV